MELRSLLPSLDDTNRKWPRVCQSKSFRNANTMSGDGSSTEEEEEEEEEEEAGENQQLGLRKPINPAQANHVRARPTRAARDCFEQGREGPHATLPAQAAPTADGGCQVGAWHAIAGPESHSSVEGSA